jgi:hypothetical protein
VIALSLATIANAVEDGGPVVRQGGTIGELRTFTARGLSSSGTVMLTTPVTGWFTVTEICGNTTKSNDREIDVRVFAGQLHIATLQEPEGGAQPKCLQFPSGMVLPRNTQVTCEGGSSHECWITGICSRDCNLPASN